MIRELFYEMLYAIVMIALLVVVGGTLLLNANEKGLAELTQIMLLCVSFVLWSAAARTAHAVRVIACFMACLSIACIGRETSWGSAYDVPHAISDMIEYVLVAILLTIVILLCRKGYSERDRIIPWLKSRQFYVVATLLIVSFLCLLMGDVFDHKVIDIYASPIIEESCEIIAYTYFARAAFYLVRVSSSVNAYTPITENNYSR